MHHDERVRMRISTNWCLVAFEAAFGSWRINVGDGVSLVFDSSHDNCGFAVQ